MQLITAATAAAKVASGIRLQSTFVSANCVPLFLCIFTDCHFKEISGPLRYSEGEGGGAETGRIASWAN